MVNESHVGVTDKEGTASHSHIEGWSGHLYDLSQ